MEDRAVELVKTRNGWDTRVDENTHSRYEHLRPDRVAFALRVSDGDAPDRSSLIPLCIGHGRVEYTVGAKIKLLRDILQVLQDLWLTAVRLLPVWFEDVGIAIAVDPDI